MSKPEGYHCELLNYLTPFCRYNINADKYACKVCGLQHITFMGSMNHINHKHQNILPGSKRGQEIEYPPGE